MLDPQAETEATADTPAEPSELSSGDEASSGSQDVEPEETATATLGDDDAGADDDDPDGPEEGTGSIGRDDIGAGSISVFDLFDFGLDVENNVDPKSGSRRR